MFYTTGSTVLCSAQAFAERDEHNIIQSLKIPGGWVVFNAFLLGSLAWFDADQAVRPAGRGRRSIELGLSVHAPRLAPHA